VKSTSALTDNTHKKTNKPQTKKHKATANLDSLIQRNVNFDRTDISQTKLCQEE